MASRRRSGLIAAAVLVLVLVAGTVKWFAPFVSAKRDVIVATPSLGAIFQRGIVKAPPRGRACVAPVHFDADTQVARLRLYARGPAPAPSVTVVAEAPGYRSLVPIPAFPVGEDQLVNAPLTTPPSPRDGRVCVVNHGRRSVQLVGAREWRSLVPAETSVNGKVVPDVDVELTLLKTRPQSLASRPGDVVSHASALAGAYGPSWLLWPLLILAALGIPAAVIAALVTSRDRD